MSPLPRKAVAPGRPPNLDLVPLADRLRYTHYLRAVLVLVAVLAHVLAVAEGLPLSVLGPVTVAYVAMAFAVSQGMRWGHAAALNVFGLSLIADGLYIGVVTYGTLGFSTPFQYLVVVHLVVVTLLASFRTGMKIAVWHTVLAVTFFQLHRDGVVVPLGEAGGWGEILLFLAIAWIVTGATATSAAVNERELRRRNYDLQALAQFSFRLESASQPGQVADSLVKAVVDEFAVPRAVLLAADTGTLQPLGRHGVTVTPDGSPENDDLLRRTLQGRRTHRVDHLYDSVDPWLSQALPGAQNIVTIPLVAEDSPVGALVLEYGRHRGARIERRVVTMIERFASQASLALSNAWLLAQVQASASTDALTGIANRRSFDQQLDREMSRAERNGTSLAVALLDIDHFKRLNDTYGHQTGDVCLQRVAAAISGAVRAGDVVARYGGEEFVVIMPTTALDDARLVAERVRASVEAIAEEPRMTVSVGVATYPLNADAGVDVVAAADAALYEAKDGGRNRVVRSARTHPATVPSPRNGETVRSLTGEA